VSDVDVGSDNDFFSQAATDFLRRRFGLSNSSWLEMVSRLMRSSLEGHGCTLLPSYIELPVSESDTPGFLQSVNDSDLAVVRPGQLTVPLVTWRNYLFTQRQFGDELTVARQIIARTRIPSNDSALVFTHLDALADDLLPVQDSDQLPSGKNDLPNKAAKGLLRSALGVLTGGPGTGKTYTLARCLALVAKGYLDAGLNPRIAVCAPTGKAATRAEELLVSFAQDRDVQSLIGIDVVNQLSQVAPMTVHRLLGDRLYTPTGGNQVSEHYLPFDVVIVDETSMMSTALMSSLLRAISPSARILLVGDPAQLESVEVGSVLGEIVAASQHLDGAVHELRHIYRAEKSSQIPLLARAIRAGDADSVVAQLNSNHPTTRWVRQDLNKRPPKDVVQQIVDALGEPVSTARSVAASDEERLGALRKINANKILCGPREGTTGVSAWNAAIADALGLALVDPPAPGTPILVTVNAPKLGLVNGSLGLVTAVEVDGERRERVAFEENGTVKYLDRGQLPAHEVCFAMTVHKSQGSEYGGLLVVALPGGGSPLLTRELFYTGVTRGKNSVVVVAEEDSIRNATITSSNRTSAIREMIRTLADEQLSGGSIW